MKTTIEIPDDLLKDAKAVAAAEDRTLRSLIEEALRAMLTKRRKSKQGFTLRDAAVAGRGVQSGLTEGDWDGVRDLIYRGRGG